MQQKRRVIWNSLFIVMYFSPRNELSGFAREVLAEVQRLKNHFLKM